MPCFLPEGSVNKVNTMVLNKVKTTHTVVLPFQKILGQYYEG